MRTRYPVLNIQYRVIGNVVFHVSRPHSDGKSVRGEQDGIETHVETGNEGIIVRVGPYKSEYLSEYIVNTRYVDKGQEDRAREERVDHGAFIHQINEYDNLQEETRDIDSRAVHVNEQKSVEEEKQARHLPVGLPPGDQGNEKEGGKEGEKRAHVVLVFQETAGHPPLAAEVRGPEMDTREYLQITPQNEEGADAGEEQDKGVPLRFFSDEDRHGYDQHCGD